MTRHAVLALEDGTILRGRAFGAVTTVCGEAVFNTSMSGYQEILTDPSYFGQIVTMTVPQIGNYGVNEEDLESSKPHAAGFVVRELSPVVSNWRATSDLGSWLAKHGIPGIEGENVNMHDVGHGKTIGGVAAEEIRRRSELHHMKVMEKIATRLKSVPEGKGTMFDNTMIFYFPNSGETHHSHGLEFPFVVLSGANSRVKLGNRYVRLPYWGKPGHKTLGNFYTTLLNAYGNPIKHFGDPDISLKLEQTGPIKEFLA